MKTKWQFRFKKWLGDGLVVAGFRRNGRGNWLSAANVPEHVRLWFDVKELNCLWVCTAFKTLEEFRAKACNCLIQNKGKRDAQLYVQGTAEVEYDPPVQELSRLDCMQGHGDGAHNGLTDWYESIEKGILAALRNFGRDAAWTTGWYSSKKAIASACIRHFDRTIHVEVSCSDDLDTEGKGEAVIPHTINLDKVRKAIDEAWDQAEQNRRDNQPYVGFSVHNPQGEWVETYLASNGEYEEPPGDNYSHWGWQEDGEVPAEVKSKMEEWLDTALYDEAQASYTFQQWTIKRWSEGND